MRELIMEKFLSSMLTQKPPTESLLVTHSREARLQQLTNSQKEILVHTTEFLQARDSKLNKKQIQLFVLPMVEIGLPSQSILELVSRLPLDTSLDHAEIYFDFRLGSWIKILEPPTLPELLDEIVETAPSITEGCAAIEAEYQAFKVRWPGP
jgi:hypothetical protein